MKILHDWIKFAEDMERLIQPGSPLSKQLAELKGNTIRQLGLMELHKEINKCDIDIIKDIDGPDSGDFIEECIKRGRDHNEIPKNTGEISDQIGYGHKHFDND